MSGVGQAKQENRCADDKFAYHLALSDLFEADVCEGGRRFVCYWLLFGTQGREFLYAAVAAV